MTLGAGFASAGLSFAGYGTPATFATPGTTVLPDLYTGAMQTGPLLNPATGDYTFTLDGRVVGESTAPHLVKLALATVYRSACVTLGIDFTNLQMKDKNFRRDFMVALSTAVSVLVSNKVIAVSLIEVFDIPQDAAVGILHWKDLLTGLKYDTPIGGQ